MNNFENNSPFLPELNSPSAQNMFAFGNHLPIVGKFGDFQSNPSINDKTTATGNNFFGYQARKKKPDQV